MKIHKSLGIKLLKMQNMEDIVADLFEGTDANENAVLFAKDVMQVNIITGTSQDSSLMSVTPWIPFAADDFIPLYYDSVVTVVTPTSSFKEYYINIRDKWNRSKSDEPEFPDVVRSHSDRLDEVRPPTDDELDELEREEEVLEALMESKGTIKH
jgi:hypothetical protein